MKFLFNEKNVKVVTWIILVLVFLTAIILMFTRTRITSTGAVKREFGTAFVNPFAKKPDIKALEAAANASAQAAAAKPDDATLQAKAKADAEALQKAKDA